MLEQQAQSHDQHSLDTAKRRAAEFAEKQFDDKFNAHAMAMNAVKEDRENGLSNLKHFEAAAKSWQKLYDDPGWLKKK